MSIFGDIWNKIVNTAEAAVSSTAPSSPTEATPTEQAQSAATSVSEPDVEVILAHIETQKGGADSNWRTSIVDLLKLLDLNSTLDARKELAQELNVHAGEDGSAEQNIALHKAVMQKLEENGGKVPASLKGG